MFTRNSVACWGENGMFINRIIVVLMDQNGTGMLTLSANLICDGWAGGNKQHWMPKLVAIAVDESQKDGIRRQVLLVDDQASTNPLLVMGAPVAGLDVINLSAEPLDRKTPRSRRTRTSQVAHIVAHHDG
jgi:hypothetical protein